MGEHGDVLFFGGWRKCTEHTLAEYLDLDQVRLMDPQEKTRHLRRVKKAAALSIQVEELDPKDNASDFRSGDEAEDDDNDEDDEDEPETSRAIVAQPEALTVELPSTPSQALCDSPFMYFFYFVLAQTLFCSTLRLSPFDE